MTEAMIGGNILFARRAFALARGGEELWKRVLARLPAADAAQLSRVMLVTSSYPLALNLRLDEAIVAELSPHDPDQVFLEMGRASADSNLTGPQRGFVKQGDPHYLLSLTETIYAYYYSVGTRTYQNTGPHSALLKTSGAPPATPGDCLTVVGWHARAIELSGGSDVQVSEIRCRHRGHAVCEITCSWRA